LSLKAQITPLETWGVTMQFHFRTLLFTVGEGGELKLQTQDHEERHTVLIGFEFPQDLTNFAMTLLVMVGVLGSPIEPHLDADMFIDPYSSSTPMAWGLPNTATLF
jgi:hypothetical protein